MDSDMPVFNEVAAMQIPYNIKEVVATLNEVYGDIGHIGEKGPAGDPGVQGPQGLRGAIGPQGPTGNQGPVGLQGPQGLQGSQGPVGLQGPQGTAGTQGPRGAVGPQGPLGGAGASYWQIDNSGFTSKLYYMLGNVGILTKTPAYTLDVSGTVNAKTILGTTVTANTVTATRSITSPYFITQSDYRIKQHVTPLGASETVDRLRPVSYYNTLTQQDEYGLIAHEVQEVFPRLVHGEKDDADVYQSVNYNGLLSILIHEIQHLKRRISHLENREI